MDEIAAGLDDSLSFLTESAPGAPEHQRTLLAAMEWSFNLLAPASQDVLVCLSAFAGPFTVDIARQPCAPTLGSGADGFLDQLTTLVDASLVLVVRSGSDPTSYRLLQPVRDFGRRKLVQRVGRDPVPFPRLGCT